LHIPRSSADILEDAGKILKIPVYGANAKRLMMPSLIIWFYHGYEQAGFMACLKNGKFNGQWP